MVASGVSSTAPPHLWSRSSTPDQCGDVPRMLPAHARGRSTRGPGQGSLRRGGGAPGRTSAEHPTGLVEHRTVIDVPCFVPAAGCPEPHRTSLISSYGVAMGVLTPLAVRIGAISWLPRLLPQITGFDKMLQRLSRGRLGVLELAGLPNVVLTVRGRLSGELRTTPLLCVRDGSHWLIAGSSFGAPSTPAWAHNLREASSAVISKGQWRMTVAPEELASAERDRAWEILCRTWPNFELYEQRTDRLIPVFRLTPVSEV